MQSESVHGRRDDADDLEEWGVGEDEVRLMGEDEEREMGQRVPEEGTRNEERTSGGWLGGPQELQELSTTQRWGVEGVGGGGGGGESRSPSSMDVWMRLAQEVDEDREGGQGAGGR